MSCVRVSTGVLQLLSGLREDRREELAAEVRQGLQLLPSDDVRFACLPCVQLRL